MDNGEILKKLFDEAADEIIKDVLKISESEASVHLKKNKGKKISVEIKGHPASLMVLLEDGVARVIKEIVNGSYGGDEKWLFEQFVDGVRKNLNLQE